MFDLVNGVPVHPLVVHAVVVLLPLAILGTIAIAVRPRWRRTYGPLVVGCALLATVLIPVATSSGETLERRVGSPGEHAELGDQLLWFAIPLLVLAALLVYLDFREATSARAHERTAPTSGGTTVTIDRPRTARRLTTAVAALAVVVAVLNGVWVYRVGDSGAHAVWDDRVGSAQG